ncbi:MAG: hypothetical protein ABSH36_05700 [Solirubrobacteraceae bacterium]
MTDGAFQDFALRLAPFAASVANYCDHVEHNESANRAWVTDPAASLRDAASELAASARLSIIELYAERLGEIEARNVAARPGGHDGHHAALQARTWRDIQLVQIDHDRHYHPDVVGMPKLDQLRHCALHLAKIVGAFAEPREHQELLNRRLPDILLFGVKLATVMGVRLADEPLPTQMAAHAAGVSGPMSAQTQVSVDTH